MVLIESLWLGQIRLRIWIDSNCFPIESDFDIAYVRGVDANTSKQAHQTENSID